MEGWMQRRGLIVDDEAAVCEMVGKVLSSVGMETLKITRSADAPSLFEKGKFDVVLLDMHMEAPDGIELARRVRSSRWNRTTPIILISDDQRPSAMGIGFEAGANFFVYKPIDKEQLLKLLRAARGQVEQERRRTRRVAIRSRVRLQSGAQEVEGETVNLSMRGVLVKAHRTFAVGSTVNVWLMVPKQSRPITGMGSVVRVADQNQMGIRLDRLTVSESERLQEYLLPLIPEEG
jgi:DNA-binding response OmpR family regulator